MLFALQASDGKLVTVSAVCVWAITMGCALSTLATSLPEFKSIWLNEEGQLISFLTCAGIWREAGDGLSQCCVRVGHHHGLHDVHRPGR